MADTLWASGYELYDRLSEPYQKFLETLTATFHQTHFAAVAERAGFRLYDKPRGAPENVGSDLKAVHPVVRTNPVTGWKSVFPVGGHVSHINGVTEEESDRLLHWFLDLVYQNHDLQVRFKWKNPNDIGMRALNNEPPANRQLFGTTAVFSTPPRLTTRARARDLATGPSAWASGRFWTPRAHRAALL